MVGYQWSQGTISALDWWSLTPELEVARDLDGGLDEYFWSHQVRGGECQHRLEKAVGGIRPLMCAESPLQVFFLVPGVRL